MIIEENTIDDIKALVNAVLETNKRFQGQVWWRGQGCYKWHLSPFVARQNGGYEFEQNSVFRFMQRAPSRYSPTPADSNIFAWLFLMQHHGLPTRLLDWTESPLFACYFAIEPEDDAGALFALSPYLLNQHQIGEYGVLSPSHEKAMLAARKAFDSNTSDVDYIVGILPSETHTRLMVQLSVFTLHGSGLPLDESPGTDEYLVKYRIPHNSKSTLKGQLKYLGVRESNLFPDLDHLADETKKLRFNPPPTASKHKIIEKFLQDDDDWRNMSGSSP